MTPGAARDTTRVRNWPIRWEIVFLAAFTAVYAFAVIRIAALRPLWIDEIVTLRLSTLPSVHDIWAALCAGADTGPPGVYILTRLACAIAGPGPVPARLPAIAGYWCMSIGLFYFVKRWAGSALAAFSILLIGVTVAFSYATEARGYAPLLGALGVSILCWQRAIGGETGSVLKKGASHPISRELVTSNHELTRAKLAPVPVFQQPARAFWIPALAVSTAAAASFHFYAPLLYVPLFLAELVRTVRLRRIDWGVWIALIAGMAVILAYLPALRGMASANLKSAVSPNYWAAATLGAVIETYQGLSQYLLIPAAVLAAVILAMAAYFDSSSGLEPRRAPIEYAVLASGFVILPGILFVVCRLLHGAYSYRYLLPTLIGLAILSVVLIRRLPGSRFASPCLVVLFGLIFAFRLSLAVRNSNDIPEIDALRNVMTSTASEGLPVVISNPLDFMAFINNPPGDVQKRAYYVRVPESAYQTADPTGERGLLVILPWVHIERVTSLDDFLRDHRDFFVFRPGTRSDLIVPELLRRSVSLRLIRPGLLRATVP